MADASAERPAWTAVIVNYNAGSHLAACVESLLADEGLPCDEIVVVDNASTDDSLALLSERVHECEHVRVVAAPGNVGYARAANLGSAVARSEIIAVLNPDLVVRPGTAAALVQRFALEPKLGALGPRIVTVDGTDYPSAREVPGFTTALGHFLLGFIAPSNRWTRRYRQEHIAADVARPADWISGAAIWLRRAALDDVGGWDERYFMFLEEVDLCVRLREAGWGVAYEPGGQVVHVEGVSRRLHPYRTIADHHRSAYRFAAAHWRGPRRALLPLAAAALAARATALIVVARLRIGRAE